MKPVDGVIPERELNGAQEVCYGVGQEAYQELPAVRTPQGVVVSKWRLTNEEIETIRLTGCLFVEQMTFGFNLQPIRVRVDQPVLDAKGEVRE